MRKTGITLFRIIIIITIIVGIATVVLGIRVYDNPRVVYREVVDKAVKNGTYMVFTRDTEGNPYSYEISDAIHLGKFNSSDIYASITVGEHYQFSITGRRIPILSVYPNINSAILISALD